MKNQFKPGLNSPESARGTGRGTLHLPRHNEAVGYNGPLNKAKVTKEYKRHVCKIWTSELYSGNKIRAHNTFAVPLITPTIGGFELDKEGN